MSVKVIIDTSRVIRSDEPIRLEVTIAEDCPFCGDDMICGKCSRRCPASRRDAERVERMDSK